MTGRATFGEFLQAARKCTEPEGHGGRVTGRHDIVGVSHGLGRVVAAMSRYLDDVMASYPMLPSAKRSAESCVGTGCLAGAGSTQQRRPAPATPAGQRQASVAAGQRAWAAAGGDVGVADCWP